MQNVFLLCIHTKLLNIYVHACLSTKYVFEFFYNIHHAVNFLKIFRDLFIWKNHKGKGRREKKEERNKEREGKRRRSSMYEFTCQLAATGRSGLG